MRTIIFAALLLSIFSQGVKAQLYCTNSSEQPVWLAIAFNYVPNATDPSPASDSDRWVTQGWVYLNVGQTAQLSNHIGFSKTDGIKTNFFYYAYQPVQGGREWMGSRKFLINDHPSDIDPNVFMTWIDYANQPDRYKDQPNIRYVPFKGATEGKVSEFTIVLKQDDENEPMMTVEMKHAFW